MVPDGPEDGPPRLEYLNLNNTPVDDNAVPFLSSCTNLKTLELAGTKVTSTYSQKHVHLITRPTFPITEDGLLHLLDACDNLEKLDLTSCRGVRIGERRRFFEVRVDSRFTKPGHHQTFPSGLGRVEERMNVAVFSPIGTHALCIFTGLHYYLSLAESYVYAL